MSTVTGDGQDQREEDSQRISVCSSEIGDDMTSFESIDAPRGESYINVLQDNLNTLFEAKLEALEREEERSEGDVVGVYKEWVANLTERSRLLSESLGSVTRELEEKKRTLEEKVEDSATFAKNHMTIIQQYEGQVQELLRDRDGCHKLQMGLTEKVSDLEEQLRRSADKEVVTKRENEILITLLCRLRDTGIWDTSDLKFGGVTFNKLFGRYPSLPNSHVTPSPLSKDKVEAAEVNEKRVQELSRRIVELETTLETKDKEIDKLNAEVRSLTLKNEESSLEVVQLKEKSIEDEANCNKSLPSTPAEVTEELVPLKTPSNGGQTPILGEPLKEEVNENALELLRDLVDTYQTKYNTVQTLLNSKCEVIESLEAQMKLLNEKVQSLEIEKPIVKTTLLEAGDKSSPRTEVKEVPEEPLTSKTKGSTLPKSTDHSKPSSAEVEVDELYSRERRSGQEQSSPLKPFPSARQGHTCRCNFGSEEGGGEKRRFFYARPPWNDNFHKGKFLDPNKRKKEYRLVPVNPFQRPHPDLFTEDFYKRKERESSRKSYHPPPPPQAIRKPRVEAAQRKLIEIEQKLQEEKLKAQREENDRRYNAHSSRNKSAPLEPLSAPSGRGSSGQGEEIGGYFGTKRKIPAGKGRKEYIRMPGKPVNQEGDVSWDKESKEESWEGKNETLDLLMSAALRASRKLSREQTDEGSFTVFACHKHKHRTHRRRQETPKEKERSVVSKEEDVVDTSGPSMTSVGDHAPYERLLKLLPADSQADCVKNWFSKSQGPSKASRKNSGFQSTLHTIQESDLSGVSGHSRVIRGRTKRKSLSNSNLLSPI